ncbi:MerR family transcriptional regulator [Glycomyces algeriensis]|uniref:MerR family transcriptional regulator n=1 Tax=Glycomyces algeriensis TaxID=256037 RepID=A0A9W6GC14_9ACTN|nr:MerR family transcriptional regulator [Glycomyces algeriensis]MDA1365610.1 MerR family transcriptional regulator [Glycomyces algeriensis]MDR7351298.1 DNA-binding transcriptional MerR regulator [Glycomyces algeriensis]GLI44013.1 MerR family transcriptional regulator [Glycomyces algeriensis]
MNDRQHHPHRAPGGLTVGGAAALVGVSVRTLHHWDEIGLARPSHRTGAGYRLYTDDDIARVHRVLVYREIGMALSEIKRLLDDPAVDAREHLRRQKAQLQDGIARMERMAGAVDRMLDALSEGIRLTAEEQVAIFGESWDPDWQAGAEKRWGDTPQWRQYAERAAHLDAEGWKAIAARTEALNADLVDAKRAGAVPGSAAANALAERHRELMSTYFDCSHAMHVCIGRTFVDDAAFTANVDAAEPGLAAWLREVIDANAEANGTDPETATWN